MVISLKEKLLPPIKKGEKLEKTRSSSGASPPPSYRAIDNPDYGLSASIRKLNLRSNAPSASGSTIPTTDECIAHLKLLTAFAHLREEISESDGLFGLHDALAGETDGEKFALTGSLKSVRASPHTPQVPAIAKVREKRWAVYVTRAVDRFQKWWETLIPGHGREVEIRMNDFVSSNAPNRTEALEDQPRLNWKPEMLPPLDVLMVLHSYMLNPRNFLDDCLRYGMLPAWSAGFPWDLVNASITDRSFDYSPDEAIPTFEAKTGLNWDNLQDPHSKRIDCPSCHKTLHHPYTDGNFGIIPDKAFEDGRGFADKSFEAVCVNCGMVINYQTLCLYKFHQDVQRLIHDNVPMPGTILSLMGTPDPNKSSDPSKHEVFFPNRLILAGLYTNLLDISRPEVGAQGRVQIEDVRKEVEKALKDRSLVSNANGKSFSKSLKRPEKIAVRRMMSKYWQNCSPLGLDLVGAVLRQGIFVDKMKSIDWIHSPALENTMTRLIGKYVNFFKIIEQNPGRTAVPTLDVDLAWHTHQLNPKAYFQYSIEHASGQFVDHDDKIDENVLSTAFEWTTRQYAKVTNGEVYSECTCWYCEAIREANNTRSLFGSARGAGAQAVALHDRKDISKDPSKNPHISAHNSVKAESLAADRIARVQGAKLQADYERAAKRARKAGKVPPDRMAYANAYVWGYPMFLPYGYYYPYCSDPGITGSMYPANPSCMSVGYGAAGNCAAGSCGGGVAAGSCGGAGAGGGCAGGAAGGCGASGAGGCGGGGGGGGCGGGGGGGGGCGGGGGGG